MITKGEFLEKYNISRDLFVSAGMSWEDLCYIYEDFREIKFSEYENILDDFTNTYLKRVNQVKINGEENVKVHSILSRVKDPEHLIAKIVRKKQDNSNKYDKLDKTNYEKFITDLIGIRCLILFKSDWKSFHNYITSQFENVSDYYIKDSILDFDDNIDHYYIAEEPKVHIRNGDEREIYNDVISPDHILDNKEYRSVHYIIKYKGVYLEIQVRTLFEEGWGEVDHAVVYPYFQEEGILKEYTKLLNRLTGLADEMSGFFYHLKEIETECKEKVLIGGSDKVKEQIIPAQTNEKVDVFDSSMSDDINSEHTPNDCLKSVLND